MLRSYEAVSVSTLNAIKASPHINAKVGDYFDKALATHYNRREPKSG